ncbi:hypothetical protein AV656_12910 [Bhargavaea cecembensis]|uniref:HAAS transmembrane region domain-containing protein n=1 Tax=Bhargavaea cecembensis TaxID=394098 RepID=A0A163EXW8_9BACL|nr:DUF1129 family protein [Bhargavaea cecembensis]KZE37461.1 hypothetical protein AV656_12910 [Bhargavaea cecembensis]
MKLSRESEEFIANVRMYLMTSGKNEREIDEVAEELEDHLAELEHRGESVDRITGGSPKEYFASLEQEMDNDYAGWLKYVPAFLLAFAAFAAMGPAIRGMFSLNLLQLIGYPLVAVIVAVLYRNMFRKMAAGQWSNRKLFLAGGGLSMLSVFLFVGVLLASSLIMDPFYTAGRTGNLAVIVLSVVAFAAAAMMTGSWLLITIAVALFLPEWLILSMPFQEEAKMVASAFIPFIAVALVIAAHLFYERRKIDRA